MRDIRTDLRERLAVLDGRYADEMVGYDRQREALEAAHREAIDAIKRERLAVEQLLAIEDSRDGTVPLPVDRRRLAPLTDFLISKVCTHGPVDKDQLRAEADAAGYFDEGNGRSFHTTLLNAVRGGRIVLASDGRYSAPPLPDSRFTMHQEGEMPTIM